MAEKKAKKGGKKYCSAGGSGEINYDNMTGTLDITMHYFPSDEKLRAKWTRFVTGNPHKLCDRLYFEFIEEMYGNVKNPRIIVLDCDKYSHLTSKKAYFHLKCCVLSFLRLTTAILAI